MLSCSGVLRAELIGHYKFDGDASDSSGHGNDGTPEGDAAYAGDGTGVSGGSFTFGGAGVRGASALGKVIGTTVRTGDANTNNQVTVPAASSYQAEPMSIASSIYSYFGAMNPHHLTADPDMNPEGDVPLDETLTGEDALFIPV